MIPGDHRSIVLDSVQTSSRLSQQADVGGFPVRWVGRAAVSVRADTRVSLSAAWLALS